MFRFRIGTGLVATAALAAALIVAPATGALAAPAPVGLGDVATYAVLGGEQVTNTGPSVIGGNVGVAPGTAITGFEGGPGVIVGGRMFKPDAANAARAAVGTAYLDAAGRTGTVLPGVELAGMTLATGVYTAGESGTFGLTGKLTLNGSASDVWIFQTEYTLITAAASSVVLTGGAQACNVFWKIGSSATLGAASKFTGTVLAAATITVGNGADIVGRLLAGSGEVTLINDTITRSDCATVDEESEEAEAAATADAAAAEAAEAAAEAAQAAADAADAAADAVAAALAADAAAAATEASEAAARAEDASAIATDAAERAADAAEVTDDSPFDLAADVDATAAARSASDAFDSAVTAGVSRDAALVRAGLALAATGSTPPSPLLPIALILLGAAALVGSRFALRR